MWTVTIYRDNGYSGENYTKHFKKEEDAYNYFEEEIKIEFEEEIEEGLVSPQEIQNILNNNIYRYENDKYEVVISLDFNE